MAETMSNVERVLWRIAELGARCSQHSAAGSRGPLWTELEHTIAGLEAEFETARQAVDTAPAQVRSLEGRLKVARQERDRERARAQEFLGDAEAARRERDRERHNARKAMAAAAAAKKAAAESAARVAAAEAATDQALAARDQAVGAFDQAVSTGERAADARDQALDARDQATAARDQALAARDQATVARHQAMAARDDAIAARDQAMAALDEATAHIAQLESALEAASAERDEAVDTLTVRADGAVVVLPGVALPDAPPAGPIPPADPMPASGRRVSWQPTWSEWARDTAGEPAVMADAEVDVADEVVLVSEAEEEETGVRRYLNVAATIGQLLPDDLGPYLLPGASVIRREGRLFATVAVTTNPWKTSGSDGTQQAQVFADAGFRAEWTSAAPLAC